MRSISLFIRRGKLVPGVQLEGGRHSVGGEGSPFYGVGSDKIRLHRGSSECTAAAVIFSTVITFEIFLYSLTFDIMKTKTQKTPKKPTALYRFFIKSKTVN